MTEEQLLDLIGPLEQYKDLNHDLFEVRTSYLLWAAMPHLFTREEAFSLAPIWGKINNVKDYYSKIGFVGHIAQTGVGRKEFENNLEEQYGNDEVEE